MTADAIASLITGGTTDLGLAGVFLLLFVNGKLHSDREFQREVKRGNREQARAERLQRDLTEARRELSEATGRADAAVRSSELIATALIGSSQYPLRALGK